MILANELRQNLESKKPVMQTAAAFLQDFTFLCLQIFAAILAIGLLGFTIFAIFGFVAKSKR